MGHAKSFRGTAPSLSSEKHQQGSCSQTLVALADVDPMQPCSGWYTGCTPWPSAQNFVRFLLQDIRACLARSRQLYSRQSYECREQSETLKRKTPFWSAPKRLPS